MIRAEDVADLREGDVVELAFPSGSVIRGPLTSEEHYSPGLGIASAGWSVRDREGEPGWGMTQENATLTVVSRAPRPLYVNHPRTEPEFGDTARNGGFDESDRVYWRADGFWLCNDAGRYDDDQMPARLRLLVDGETGRCVP